MIIESNIRASVLLYVLNSLEKVIICSASLTFDHFSLTNLWASPASLRCGPWARPIYPSLVLVQPRKTRPCLTERWLMGCKESNQTNKKKKTNLINSVIHEHLCKILHLQSYVITVSAGIVVNSQDVKSISQVKITRWFFFWQFEYICICAVYKCSITPDRRQSKMLIITNECG